MRRLVPTRSSVGFAMPQREPLVYPFRSADRFPYDIGIPDRQLWAIGMITVQWSATEFFMRNQMQIVARYDAGAKEEFAKQRNFQQRAVFWETQAELKLKDPLRSEILALISRMKNLKAQRDEVVHRSWGGGLQSGSWIAGNQSLPTTDASPMKAPWDKQKPRNPHDLFSWNISFSRLRRLAEDIAALNRDLLVATMVPRDGTDHDAPHGNVNT